MSNGPNDDPAPVRRPVRFDPIISKWDSYRRYVDWCGPGAIVSVPADELYHIIDRIREIAQEIEIAKAERNKAHVVAHQKAMEMVRQAEEGRQYWMHAALGRETDGDERDAELLRLAARLHEVEPNAKDDRAAASAAPS
jgi:hypothetical protein